MTKLSNAMSRSFVEDYKEHKNSIDTVNADLKKCGIPYQYSYDEYCKDFMKETKRNMNFLEYFAYERTNKLGYWQFNLFNLRSMLKRKLEGLGYDFEKFYEQSVLKTNIYSKYQDLLMKGNRK